MVSSGTISAPATAQSTAAPSPAVEAARRIIEIEAHGLDALSGALGGPLGAAFEAAVERICQAHGRVIVTGIGKSGQIARKIASTLASTGTPAYFVHAGEASHGDLGMVTADDVVLALSWSGETRELGDIINYAVRFNVALLAMTSMVESTLARAADIVLELPRAIEACPHGLAPTTSALIQLALGDALALTLLERRGFTPSDFRTFHPGGKLGAALRHVRDVMRGGAQTPLVAIGAPMSDAILELSRGGAGCVGVVDLDGRLIGIATDGDLRRHMAPDLLSKRVDDIMTRGPKVIAPDELVGEALDIMDRNRISALFAVEDGRPIGVLHMHDLLNIGLV